MPCSRTATRTLGTAPPAGPPGAPHSPFCRSGAVPTSVCAAACEAGEVYMAKRPARPPSAPLGKTAQGEEHKSPPRSGQNPK